MKKTLFHVAASMHAGSVKGAEILIEVALSHLISTGRNTAANASRTAMEDEKYARRRVLKDWINRAASDKDKFMPLHYASFYGNISLIKLLVRHGADI